MLRVGVGSRVSQSLRVERRFWMKKRKGRRNKVEGNRTRGSRYIYVSSSLAKGERCVAKPAQAIRSDALSSARTNKQRGDSPGSDGSSPKESHTRSSSSIVVVSSNRSLKRRLVNDTSSSMLLSRACDAARDRRFDETREDGSFAETPDARVGTTPFRLGPSIPPVDTSWLVFQRRIIHHQTFH